MRDEDFVSQVFMYFWALSIRMGSSYNKFYTKVCSWGETDSFPTADSSLVISSSSFNFFPSSGCLFSFRSPLYFFLHKYWHLTCSWMGFRVIFTLQKKMLRTIWHSIAQITPLCKEEKLGQNNGAIYTILKLPPWAFTYINLSSFPATNVKYHFTFYFPWAKVCLHITRWFSHTLFLSISIWNHHKFVDTLSIRENI